MNRNDLPKLINLAGRMAVQNIWSENAFKINMAILRLDKNNTAAYTRLAKYYKLNNNIEDAKIMYQKALEIDPENRGAINNLNEIEKNKYKNLNK